MTTKRSMAGRKIPALATLMLLAAPSAAFAAEEAMSQTHGNILWTLLAAILVFFMQAGFACVEAGFTRAKSAGNILMKTFSIFHGSIIFFCSARPHVRIDAGGFIGTSGFHLQEQDSLTRMDSGLSLSGSSSPYSRQLLPLSYPAVLQNEPNSAAIS